MAFRNSILAGEELVRSAIRSANWDPGVAGWRIDRDGNAEFNDITARGTISTGAPGSQHIEIASTTGLANRIQFFTGDVDELSPGYLRVYTVPDGTDGTGPCLELSVPSFFNRPFITPARIKMTNDPGGATPATSGVTLTAERVDLTALIVEIAGQIRRNGRRLAGGCRGGLVTGTTGAAGQVTIAHELDYTPNFAVVTWKMGGGGGEPVDVIALPKILSLDATNINVRVIRTDTSARLALNPYEIYWYAGESW